MKIVKFDPNLPTLSLGPMRLKKSVRPENVSRFRFRSSDGADIAAQEWLRMWAGLYPHHYNQEHDDLIARYESFSAEDFERIGRWKDAANTKAKWKINVASVAYPIWMQAASQPPRCPDETAVAAFLEDWSEKNYVDQYTSRTIQKRFGLSRATTLLYFISGKRYPIFDARVRKAMTRLLNSSVPNTVRWYMDSYRPLFLEIATVSGAKDVRTVDKALFSFGDRSLEFPD